ncbi:(2Fe-2S)-binding protein [Trinickia caryophylli]|uniref:2Fe-2S iron-sulfur cluster binding domain-containing protein n=1 Tax=Trinickia caryophylli TaxID=28094 RepID=A0A1X7FUG2_TRICW|nr:(2Fe-2S)-binding protein [Trinickia caryophylli]PMS11854.1 NAD(FAD)-dependent dehydrogenase [Trinickia caryophylli]TRX14070.1 (2Fe-2S)-binding protein [Trinickia caryophylli]WQE13888.1 (2Fe-2S)-binding protein [Trinickia caryophylli]SMF58973.1 2Fe-2S iron-sulfur cluster binding domain-containing protein [Trinickia caryophylli]GLU33561.1 ferredoxin [Trinickia caryophylli]
MTTTPVFRPAATAIDDAQFVRLAECDRPSVAFSLDGRPAQALAGDTVLTAILLAQRRVRTSEFGGRPRAGFCLIGACQDCWVRTEDGARVRACSTPIADGMRILTDAPGATSGGVR